MTTAPDHYPASYDYRRSQPISRHIRINSLALPGSHGPQLIQVEPAHDPSPRPQVISIGSPGHTGPITGTHPGTIIVEGSADSDAGPQLSMYPTLGVRIQGHLPRYTVIAHARSRRQWSWSIDPSKGRWRTERVANESGGSHTGTP
ncbi:hypothetical protein FS749_010971 [Ceratobasidium sp. UAMH 11750]|nr:hypothetical protein FS749_010971 [Ceratobasidium sp. UAMH 11750]